MLVIAGCKSFFFPCLSQTVPQLTAQKCNKFHLVEENLFFAFRLKHRVNALCYGEWKQERVKRGGVKNTSNSKNQCHTAMY